MEPSECNLDPNLFHFCVYSTSDLEELLSAVEDFATQPGDNGQVDSVFIIACDDNGDELTFSGYQTGRSYSISGCERCCHQEVQESQSLLHRTKIIRIKVAYSQIEKRLHEVLRENDFFTLWLDCEKLNCCFHVKEEQETVWIHVHYLDQEAGKKLDYGIRLNGTRLEDE